MIKKKSINIFLITSIFIYLFISISSIYSASMYLSPSLGNLPLKQLVWYIVGIAIIYIFSKINNKYLYKYALLYYSGGILMLIGLLLVAPSINGSKSWFIISGIGSMQPSEFMKIALVLINAKVISNFLDNKKQVTLYKEFKLLLLIILIFIIPSILTFMQPDTGIVIIYFISTILMLYISGIRKRWFIGTIAVLLTTISIFIYIYYNNQQMFIDIFGSSFFYRIDRLLNWQNGTGMQLNNSLAAIGSSGITGHGFNNTPVYFPEAGTDFIFTVFSSNFGLIGSIAILGFLLLFDMYIINIGKSCHKNRDKYVIAGIMGIIIYQQIQNIGMTLGLIPITGITLPLISYGGSSLLSYLIMIGIIINIDILNKKKKSYKKL